MKLIQIQLVFLLLISFEVVGCRTGKTIIENKKERVTLVGQNYQKAEYIYTNHISEVDKRFNDKYDIPGNFFKLYEYKIDGTLLYTVYKKNKL